MTKLIVGLGNPGDEHKEDRHNAGFWFVDALAKQLNARFETEKRFHGKVAKAKWGSEDLFLLKPSTYMNLSGQAVGALCRFHKITPQDVLVVQDELDLGLEIQLILHHQHILGRNFVEAAKCPYGLTTEIHIGRGL